MTIQLVLPNRDMPFAPDINSSSPFMRDMLRALAEKPRSISPKYFYDDIGSILFDRICDLPDYYPTRAELGILDRFGAQIAAAIGPSAEVIEFGAGSLTKARLLFDAFADTDAPSAYIPIDISGPHLEASAAKLRLEYSQLNILPVVADYTMPLSLPEMKATSGKRVGFFPGSTLGNFEPHEALAFLKQTATLLRGGGLLIGVDLVKDPARLHAAYNDSDGVTAAFNLNLLRRANTELGADFDLDGFYHHAFYSPVLQRIEMHLVSKRAQLVNLDGHTFHFAEGESLRTECSHKFTVDGFRQLAMKAGYLPSQVWVDAGRLFSVHWLKAPV